MAAFNREDEVKSGFAPRAIRCAALAALWLVGGCAYTTVSKKFDPPAPGPPVITGQTAAMPQVDDKRSWPAMESRAPISNVRIFQKQITQQLRRDLLRRRHFANLPAPDDPQGREAANRLTVTVTAFKLGKTGFNAWVAPHLLLDGLVLPVYTVTALATGGEVDLGGYLLPSTKLAAVLSAQAAWRARGLAAPVLQRSYQINLPLGAVSQRSLINKLGDAQTYGSLVGREQGVRALERLAETMSRDPHWAYLPQYRLLALARTMHQKYRAAYESRKKNGKQKAAAAGSATAGKVTPWRPDGFRPPSLAETIRAAGRLVDVLPKPAYFSEVAQVLRDGYLKHKKEPAQRAALANSIRALRLGLADPESLPAELALKPGDMDSLYDDPGVERALVEESLAKQMLKLVTAVLTPPQPGDGPAPAPPAGALMIDGQAWTCLLYTSPSPRG